MAMDPPPADNAMPSVVTSTTPLRRLAHQLPDPVQQVLRILSGRSGGEDRWCRLRMDEHVADRLSQLDPSTKSAVEISGEDHAYRGWRRYQSLVYPEFDLCEPGNSPEQFDVVLCEQVLEHVNDPITAVRTLVSLCRPGGWIVVSTPFLVRLHRHPYDHWRFSPSGLQILLEHGGVKDVEVHSWGNRSCVRSNLEVWRHLRPWHRLTDEADYPLVVWAYGRPGAA